MILRAVTSGILRALQTPHFPLDRVCERARAVVAASTFRGAQQAAPARGPAVGGNEPKIITVQ